MNNNGEMKHIYISMLGPRHVGKSSLLASMYKTFDNVVGTLNLVLKPLNGEVSATLEERYLQMLAQLQERRGVAGPGLEGDEESSEYSFTLGVRGVNPNIALHFYDYPGGWLEGNHDRRTEVIEQMRRSHAILLAVDTPALMVDDHYGDWNYWHHKTNRTSLILDLFKELHIDLQMPKLILIAPIKCEKWLQNSKDSDRLVDMIKNGYKSLISELSNYQSATLAIAPVQTLGSREWSSRNKVTQGNKEFLIDRFSNINDDKYGKAQYAPKNIEQPLIYTLSFILKQVHEEAKKSQVDLDKQLNDRSWFRKVLDSIFDIDEDIRNQRRDLVEIAESLGQAGEKLAYKRLDNGVDGFHVLQGKKNLLRSI